MTPTTRSFVVALAAGALACSVTPEEVRRTTGALGSENSLTSNALTSNALTSNALTSNALTSNALTSNALTSNALTSNALTSNALGPDGVTEGESARMFLRYAYSCAMPADAELVLPPMGDFPEEVIAGGLGLAPEWGEDGGLCDVTCQRWISACTLARVNADGVPVAISLRGNHPALAELDGQEIDEFTFEEAGFYGNVFGGAGELYACHSAAANPTEVTQRRCAAGADCPMVITGLCAGGEAPACELHGDAGELGGCGEPFGVNVYHEVITVFLLDPCGGDECPIAAPVCGDAVCEGEESCDGCAIDCGSCVVLTDCPYTEETCAMIEAACAEDEASCAKAREEACLAEPEACPAECPFTPETCAWLDATCAEGEEACAQAQLEACDMEPEACPADPEPTTCPGEGEVACEVSIG